MIFMLEMLAKLGFVTSVPALRAKMQSGVNVAHEFQCFGKLLHKVIAGWEENECKFVFESLKGLTNCGICCGNVYLTLMIIRRAVYGEHIEYA